MADGDLFPTFDLESILEDEPVEERYYPSASFDFEKGDFVLDGANRIVTATGREAYMQWCLKVIDTEREEFAAYSDDIGTEFDEISDDGDRARKESDIQETITDALMVHPATEDVSDFSFVHLPDACLVTFTVKGADWEEQELTVSVRT